MANTSALFVSVRLGSGASTFTPPDVVLVGTTPRALAAGDVINDDHPDLLVSQVHLNEVSVRINQDTTPPTVPTCRIRATFAGPPKQLVVGAFDLRSGVRRIEVTTSVNATVRVEPFAPLGRFSPEVKAVVTKIDPAQAARVAFVITDGAGQRASCY